MEGYDGMGMPTYLSGSIPMGSLNAENYQGILPSMGMPEQVTPSYDTSDFGSLYVESLSKSSKLPWLTSLSHAGLTIYHFCLRRCHKIRHSRTIRPTMMLLRLRPRP